MKYIIEIDEELLLWFRENIDDTSPVEIMLPYLLRYLQELLVTIKKSK